MRTEIKIEKCGKPFCVIHAETETSGITAVAEKIRRMDETGRMAVISGWDGDYCIQVRQGDIFRIYSMNKKVYVETEKETLLLKMRLYEFEQLAESIFSPKFTVFTIFCHNCTSNFIKYLNIGYKYSDNCWEIAIFAIIIK